MRKITKKYYFSVEGETELWYLKWLQDLINSTEQSQYKVSIDCQVQKDPLKRAKSLTAIGETTICHLSDYESSEPIHVEQFHTAMDRMKKATTLGKHITYQFGYSNFTFDLWIVLHKANCNGSLSHRSQYLPHINRAYSEQFEDMDDYKKEKNFKRCLGKLNLSDVINAIDRAKQIMQKNHENGYILQRYKGYEYYNENPSLNIWKAIQIILEVCGLYS